MEPKIAAAFVKAQKSFAPALKTSQNPHFRSKYADLSACVEAVIDALNSNGIALMQVPHEAEGGVMVETLFLHESGEQMSGGKFYLPASNNDAQGFGSAMTYARRYGLMAACGIAPEDDDGNAAVRAKPAEKKAPAASGAGVKQEAYDSLDDEGKAWIDGLAREVVQCHTDGLTVEQIITHIKESLGTAGHEWKEALWHRLPSNVRTFIDKTEKGIKSGDASKAAEKVRAAA